MTTKHKPTGIRRALQIAIVMASGYGRSISHRSWLVSVVLIGALLTSTKSNAEPADDTRLEIIPIKKVAERLVATLKGWTLHECDEQPTVAVEGHRGFRLVLRRTWKEFTGIQEQRAAVAPLEESDAPFELRREDWEFALIPVQPNRAPAAIKTRIKWQKCTSPYYTRDICLGEGSGYVWFTRGTLFGQEFVRETLKLEGGDDRLQLAMDGLLVKDAGEKTANSCLYIPAKFGDQALPYVESTIEEAREGDDLWRVIGCLAFLQTDRSTDLLLRLFASETDDIRRAAQYALIHEPFRKAAKQAYFDMLRRQSSVDEACRACLEFQWKDAVPILREQIAGPRYLRGLESMIRARRTLEDKPISRELLNAEQTLNTLTARDRNPELEKKIESARRFLIETDDSEAANLAALSLATRTMKGGARGARLRNVAGIEILRSRPRQSTVAFLKLLAAGIHEDDRPRVEKVLNAVANADAAGAP